MRKVFSRVKSLFSSRFSKASQELNIHLLSILFGAGLQPGTASPVNSFFFAFSSSSTLFPLSPLLLGLISTALAEEGDGTRKQIVRRGELSWPGSAECESRGVDDELRLCACETLDAPVPARRLPLIYGAEPRGGLPGPITAALICGIHNNHFVPRLFTREMKQLH